MEKKKPAAPRTRRSAATSRKQKSGFFGRHQLALLIAGGLLLLVCALTAIFACQGYRGPAVWLHIPAGASAASVRDSLHSALGSVDANRVYMFWRLSGGSPARARGVYRIDPGEAAWRTAWHLRGGMQTPVRVGWTDVRTLPQLAERVSRNMDFTPAEFLAAADSVLRAEGFAAPEFPAAFIPDSYEFYATASPAYVVKKLVGYRNRFWTPERMAAAEALGLTPVEAATLASIVEEESAKADERPSIARLYLNRIDRGMPLQADPTVKFATGDFTLRRITGKHLGIESAYNTYQHRGLPPGPIRVASREGIEAVLKAPKHDYLYMCAREDFSGYHNFATDYAEHRRNAARYQAELDRIGIKK